MLEAGDDAGFVQIAFGVVAHALRQGNLDGDATLQLLVEAEIDRRKAAGAKDALDPVAPDPFGHCF